MQLLHEENQKLPFEMLRDCMACFVLIPKNNTYTSLGYLRDRNATAHSVDSDMILF